MNHALEIILAFIVGCWFSTQFREKEFEVNNDLLRKLFNRKKKKKDAVVEKPEPMNINDSPFNQ